VEYGDYECPHTRKVAAWIRTLRKELTHHFCYIFRHLPLGNIHHHSTFAALASEVAAQRGLFWEFHEKLITHPTLPTTAVILSLAAQLGIPEDELLKELDDQATVVRVAQDALSGDDSGVTSTPAFFLNSTRLEGPLSFEILKDNMLHVLAGHHLFT
jgi:protein-disulfide isomerase